MTFSNSCCRTIDVSPFQRSLTLALQVKPRFEEAVKANQDAATIFRKTGDRHREGIALNSQELDRTAQSRQIDN
jgi:hypothetical protein